MHITLLKNHEFDRGSRANRHKGKAPQGLDTDVLLRRSAAREQSAVAVRPC